MNNEIVDHNMVGMDDDIIVRGLAIRMQNVDQNMNKIKAICDDRDDMANHHVKTTEDLNSHDRFKIQFKFKNANLYTPVECHFDPTFKYKLSDYQTPVEHLYDLPCGHNNS
jgi:hypothetical protein